MRVSISSPLVLPSPNDRRVGIRIGSFEACSGFTRVTARRIAQSPKVTFVTRLRPCQLPNKAARQLPDLSTIIRVRPSLTDGSRLRGARPKPPSPGRRTPAVKKPGLIFRPRPATHPPPARARLANGDAYHDQDDETYHQRDPGMLFDRIHESVHVLPLLRNQRGRINTISSSAGPITAD